MTIISRFNSALQYKKVCIYSVSLTNQQNMHSLLCIYHAENLRKIEGEGQF
jgi:hypothetical protein